MDFKVGDEVLDTARPWLGVGVVLSANGGFRVRFPLRGTVEEYPPDGGSLVPVGEGLD